MPVKAKIAGKLREQFLGALKGGAGVEIAALAVGVTPRAAKKKIARDQRFREDVNEARSLADNAIQARLYDKALAGDIKAIIWWLKNRQPELWKDRREVDITQEIRNYNFGYTRREEPEVREGTGGKVVDMPTPKQ